MGYLSCNHESAIATCDSHYWELKKKPTNPSKTHHKPSPIRKFTYSELLAATNGFSTGSFLGKGSHGSVYKATLDGGNLIAAVKKTKQSSSTSHQNAFDNEIEILSHVNSPHHLVNLIGFCINDSNKLIVVEYMPNGSLYELLHSKAVRPLSWTRRVRFALQVAKAVRNLHSANPPVIHRDIKSSNVLIDHRWNARLGDFGLALRGHVEDVHVKCTPPAGTLGYLDPCYLSPENLSVKSDVFSFGILLLEILSGRKAIDFNYSPPSVLDWAVPLIRRGDFDKVCDPRIGAPPDMPAIRQLAVLAAKSVRSTAEKRPTMAEVVECVKAVKKRFHAPRVWSSLKRRVVTRGKQLGNDWDMSEELARVVKVGGNRRNGKVSNVPGVEYEGVPINRTVRSRSVGPGFFSEGKMKLGFDPNRIGSGHVSRRGKTTVTRLNRSRSMGYLQSPRRLHYGGENLIANLKPKKCHAKHKDKDNPIRLTEMQMSKLTIIDKKLEQRMSKTIGLLALS